jgi:hypothetical protein
VLLTKHCGRWTSFFEVISGSYSHFTKVTIKFFILQIVLTSLHGR